MFLCILINNFYFYGILKMIFISVSNVDSQEISRNGQQNLKSFDPFIHQTMNGKYILFFFVFFSIKLFETGVYSFRLFFICISYLLIT